MLFEEQMGDGGELEERKERNWFCNVKNKLKTNNKQKYSLNGNFHIWADDASSNKQL